MWEKGRKEERVEEKVKKRKKKKKRVEKILVLLLRKHTKLWEKKKIIKKSITLSLCPVLQHAVPESGHPASETLSPCLSLL